MSILLRIKEQLPQLKTAERKVAEQILKDPAAIIDYVITELAEKCGVSDPTIVRFCQKIGLKGFMELKLNLAGELPKPVQVHRSVNEDDSPARIMDAIFDGHQGALQSLKNQVDTEMFEKAVDWLCNAKRIEFYGFGACGCVATDAQYRFCRLGVACNAFLDVHQQFWSASLLDSNSVVIALSTNGATKNIIETSRLASKAGARVIGIIGRNKSPLHPLCDMAFSLPCQEPAPAIMRFSTRIVQLALLDALFVTTLLRNSQIKENLERVRESLSDIFFEN